MPPSDFKNADVDDIVEKLTTDEAILLTAGVGFWHTHEVPRLGIPAIKGIVDALPSNVEVTYSEGASTYMEMPTLDFELTTPTGERGWIGSWYPHEHDESMTALSKPMETRLVDETRIFISTSAPKGITRRWTMKLEGQLKPREHDCTFEFGLTVSGRAKLFVDGKLVIDNWTRQRRGESFFNSGSQEEKGRVALKAGVKYNILVEFCNVRSPADGDEDEAVQDSNPGVRLGGAEVMDPDVKMAEAVKLASEADVVIAVVGLNADWETEGYDRKTLALPGRTDELITKVLAANPKTIVVTQSGSSITLPWADSVPAIVHSWYLGNSTGAAIADVLLGNKNPSGKLSLTFPKRLEDISAHGHFHSENGVVRYGEDLFVGYKHFQHRGIAPQFAFGHGLSYTTFSYSDLQLSTPVVANGDFSLTATNAFIVICTLLTFTLEVLPEEQPEVYGFNQANNCNGLVHDDRLEYDRLFGAFGWPAGNAHCNRDGTPLSMSELWGERSLQAPRRRGRRQTGLVVMVRGQILSYGLTQTGCLPPSQPRETQFYVMRGQVSLAELHRRVIFAPVDCAPSLCQHNWKGTTSKQQPYVLTSRILNNRQVGAGELVIRIMNAGKEAGELVLSMCTSLKTHHGLDDFKNADVDDIVEKLTTDEAILLTAGVSDGPNGIRGNHFFMSTPAKCLPSATALGATWDTELIEEVGLKLLAGEAKLRAAPVILAPTCNIQRNPLGGRAFESFSEDPLLSGMIAAAYVKGVQKGGIGSTIKHFVRLIPRLSCNDKENDRMAYDSILSERALREIYLMPFMLAQKYAKPWAFMTAYNRVNGTHVSENRHLLQDILRNEWKFDGLILSDWFGICSIDLSINAGLDLEMPGTNKWRTLDLMNRSITSRKLTVRTVKERARKVVELAKRVAQEAPEVIVRLPPIPVLDGDGIERTVESGEDKALMRKLAGESIVLLKNEGNLLPLKPENLKKIAIVGGNAQAVVLSGGGSAALKPSWVIEKGEYGVKVGPSSDSLPLSSTFVVSKGLEWNGL
ncbi:glycoside hydrolase family 3 protein [Hydnomerulius pinastri MD-312]|uniref:beta-glucosidase n=1 Tax=Hydnomerulius pinastri MD-312 TaxID=994086 RepID=A0A0C9WEL2_9AGAM|nr:glycoside hydrolase family 3 protein [Hydnomerulius pinastri MD-312]